MPTPRVTDQRSARARPAANGTGMVRGSPASSSTDMYIDTMIRRYRNAAIDGREHGDDRQPGGAGVDRRGDHVELGEEARGERHAGLGEQEQREGEGQHRTVAGQAAVVVEAAADVALAADHGDDAEAAGHHERVGGQVEERRLDALGRWRPARPRG